MIKFTIYPLQKRIDNPFPFPERRQMTLLGTGQHFTGDKRINLNKSKRVRFKDWLGPAGCYKSGIDISIEKTSQLQILALPAHAKAYSCTTPEWLIWVLLRFLTFTIFSVPIPPIIQHSPSQKWRWLNLEFKSQAKILASFFRNICWAFKLHKSNH